jgi:hypothetical protein
MAGIYIQTQTAQLGMDRTFQFHPGPTETAPASLTMGAVKLKRTAGTIWDTQPKCQLLRISKFRTIINNGQMEALIQDNMATKWISN